jgi:hypothetical protein
MGVDGGQLNIVCESVGWIVWLRTGSSGTFCERDNKLHMEFTNNIFT